MKPKNEFSLEFSTVYFVYFVCHVYLFTAALCWKLEFGLCVVIFSQDCNEVYAKSFTTMDCTFQIMNY